jgi:UrcA family protein
MTKSRIALVGSAMIGAALLCGAGVARAQSYDPRYDRTYDDRTETVIVHPTYNEIEKRQLVGRVNGELDPTEFTLSRPVSFSDLDLTRDEDYLELRARVRDTARDLCFELDARIPDLRGDPSADRECVRNATRNAMRAILDHRYG